MVVISSPNKIAMIEKIEREYSLDEIISKISNVDIIITEGYKLENKPKLEVFRKAAAKEVYAKDEDLFAIITDTPIKKGVAQFGFNEIKNVVDLIENKFLKS